MPGPLDVARLRAYHVPPARDRYDRRETILYALGAGAGLAELDETHILWERDLVALPTLALVLGTPGFWPMDPASGLDWTMILHGEQSLRLYRPFEPEGDVAGATTIGRMRDKGAGRPAMLTTTRELTDGATGARIASLEELWVIRGAGGFGGEDVSISLPLPAMPGRPSDDALDLPTAPNQAALYRLMGDRNPLHVDVATARAAGLDRPILHGLATMGLVGRALIHLACAGDPRRLSAMRLRFTAPVIPGDTIRTEIWDEGDGMFRFRASVPARDALVVDCGVAERDRFDA